MNSNQRAWVTFVWISGISALCAMAAIFAFPNPIWVWWLIVTIIGLVLAFMVWLKLP